MQKSKLVNVTWWEFIIKLNVQELGNIAFYKGLWVALKRAFRLWKRDPVLILTFTSNVLLHQHKHNIVSRVCWHLSSRNKMTNLRFNGVRCVLSVKKNSLVATLTLKAVIAQRWSFSSRTKRLSSMILSMASRVTLESSSWQCCEQTFKTQTLIASIMIQSAPAANVTVSKVPDPVPQCWVTC